MEEDVKFGRRCLNLYNFRFLATLLAGLTRSWRSHGMRDPVSSKELIWCAHDSMAIHPHQPPEERTSYTDKGFQQSGIAANQLVVFTCNLELASYNITSVIPQPLKQ